MTNALLAFFGVMLLLRWWLFIGAALVHLLRRLPDVPEELDVDVDVLVPAFNEERVLEGTVRSILASDHRRLKVVLIDDGSSDGTAAVMARLARDERVQALILPENIGKADALNAAFATTRAPVIVTVDADTVLDPSAVRFLAGRLSEPGVGAVASNLKVGNRDRLLTRWQSVEYVTGLHIDRRALDVLGCVTTVPGAAGAWRRSAVSRAGGWSHATLTEDTDLTLTLLEQGQEVVFEPRAIAWTEAPVSPYDLLRQRTRWMFGYLQNLWRHRSSFLHSSTLGWIGLPNLLYAHVLVFLLPIPGWIGALRVLQWQGWTPLMVGLGSFLAADLLVSGFAFAADRERLADLAQVPLQRLVWPLLLYLSFARVWLGVVRGEVVPWATPRRLGGLADRASIGTIGEMRDP